MQPAGARFGLKTGPEWARAHTYAARRGPFRAQNGPGMGPRAHLCSPPGPVSGSKRARNGPARILMQPAGARFGLKTGPEWARAHTYAARRGPFRAQNGPGMGPRAHLCSPPGLVSDSKRARNGPARTLMQPAGARFGLKTGAEWPARTLMQPAGARFGLK